MTYQYNPRVIEWFVPPTHHSHLSTTQMTHVVHWMFHQEVFWGQLSTEGPSRVGGGIETHEVTELLPFPLQKRPLCPICCRVWRKLTLWQRHGAVCGGESAACWFASPYKVGKHLELMFFAAQFTQCFVRSTSQSTAFSEDLLQKTTR